MNKPVRRIWKVLLGIVTVMVLFLAIALSAVPVPERTDFGPSISELRALSTSTGEPLPTEFRRIVVGEGTMPELALVAGRFLGTRSAVYQAHQILYGDGRTVIVDAGSDAETLERNMPGSRLHADNYARLQEAMRRADAIVLTHEHFDHSAGIAHSPYLDEVAPRAMLTEAQLHGRDPERAGFTAEVVGRLKPLHYERMHLLRPGIVLVRAPGHTPGTQLVYVRLADGREFLLVGDIAWHQDNILLPRMHPRLVNWMLGEDAEAMANQLRYLHDLQRTTPELNLVVAHDATQMAGLIQRGLVQDGLR
ncbi:MBL fold metallo-hydrolase [Archangium violaceum]|uniref:MBL fold metallo-hydrolase n=1 Tax=Archangium violaceum TaxID=83451 RepID=UPI002B3131DB|nr:MBL fold metallo-hydrolase [Archangium gephyra]